MQEKISLLLGSVRFWQVTAASAFVLLGHYWPGMEFLWDTLAAWLATVTAIGTLDSVANKIGGQTTPPEKTVNQ